MMALLKPTILTTIAMFTTVKDKKYIPTFSAPRNRDKMMFNNNERNAPITLIKKTTLAPDNKSR